MTTSILDERSRDECRASRTARAPILVEQRLSAGDEREYGLIELLIETLGQVIARIFLHEQPDIDGMPQNRRDVLNGGADVGSIDLAEVFQRNFGCRETADRSRVQSRTEKIGLHTGDEDRANRVDETDAPDCIGIR
jgi:hypothetical protein